MAHLLSKEAIGCPHCLTSPHFSPGGEMIAQIIGFTRHFLKEWNNRVYFRLKKKSCEFKDPCLFKDSGRARGR